jgi:hypothetical protein
VQLFAEIVKRPDTRCLKSSEIRASQGFSGKFQRVLTGFGVCYAQIAVLPGGGMRRVWIVCTVLVFAGVAFGQVQVQSGWGSTSGWGGYYPPAPFVPIVSTPGISFQTYGPNSVGASNATEGLAAGASNATLSMSYPSTLNAYTVPVWTSGNASSSFGAMVQHREMHTIIHERSMHEPRMNEDMARGEQMISFGSASMSMGSGVGERVKTLQALHGTAKRTYTNQDIERIQQQKGTVKFNGKTETIG